MLKSNFNVSPFKFTVFTKATKLIVSGFIEPVVKELPLEYAVELNRLIELEIENSVC